MKKKYILLLIFSIFFLLTTSCSDSGSRPFEILAGIIPLPEVDWAKLDSYDVETHLFAKELGWQDHYDEYDLAINNNILYAFHESLLEQFFLPTNLSSTSLSNYSYDVTVRGFSSRGKGIECTSTNFYIAINEAAYNLATISICSFNTNYGLRTEGRDLRIQNFTIRYLDQDPDDSSIFYLSRYHVPIQTDNSYPESEGAKEQDMIRAVKLSANNDMENRILFTIRVPGQRCFGLSAHKGLLYFIARTFRVEDGTRLEENWDEYGLYQIDTKTMDIKICNQKYRKMVGLTSDGTHLYSFVNPTKENYGQLQLIRITP